MPERKIKLILESLSAAEEAALAARPLPDDIGKPQFRRLQGAVQKDGYDAEARTITATISSETPVSRWDGEEILLHGTDNIDTSRLDQGISHLYNHNWDILLGRTLTFEIKNRKLKVTSAFATNEDAKKREQDIAGGYLPDVSLGYLILKVEVTEDKNGLRTYNVVRWMPYEWSSVTVPADITVGVNRSAAVEAHDVEVVFRKLDAPSTPAIETTPAAEAAAAPEQVQAPAAAAETAVADPTPTETTQQRTQPMATAAVVSDPQAQNKERIAGLRALRTQYGSHFSETQLMDAIAGDTTPEQARTLIADGIIAGAQGTQVRSAADTVIGNFSEKEKRQYSRSGAARAAVNMLRAGTFSDTESGFALEISNEIRKQATERGISGLGNGILTPGVTNARFAQMEAERTIQSGSGSVATATNYTNVIVPPIELLRSKTMVLALGARMIPGLHGTPQFTRQNATASSSWLAEGASVSPTDPGLDFFQMAPHRLSMASAYTRDFLALSALAIDGFLAEDRNAVLARSLDYACLAGSGTGNVPLGLINRVGLAAVLSGSTRANDGTVTAGAGGAPLTYVDANNYEATISTANGDIGTMAWLSTPKARAAWRSTPILPGTASGMIMPNSKVGANGIQEGPLGYNGLFSSAVPTNGTVNSVPNLHLVVLGVWDQMLIGDWDLSEIIADNITGAPSATYKIFEHGYYDTNVRHLESFVAGYVKA